MMYNPVTDSFTEFTTINPPKVTLNTMNNIYDSPLDITSIASSVTEDGKVILKPERSPLITPEEAFRYNPDNYETQQVSDQQEPVEISTNYTEPPMKFKGKTLISNRLNNNQKTIALNLMNGLVNRGFKPHQAAGIVGNMVVESSLNFGNVNSNDLGSASRGIIQWKDTRFTNLQNFAKKKGKSWKDQEVQLDYLMLELQNDYSDVYNALLNSTNEVDASEAFAPFEKYAGYDGTTKTAKKAGYTQERVDFEHFNRASYAYEVYGLWKNSKK